jgi:hypothetical protein
MNPAIIDLRIGVERLKSIAKHSKMLNEKC